jgi:hypothetical protein
MIRVVIVWDFQPTGARKGAHCLGDRQRRNLQLRQIVFHEPRHVRVRLESNDARDTTRLRTDERRKRPDISATVEQHNVRQWLQQTAERMNQSLFVVLNLLLVPAVVWPEKWDTKVYTSAQLILDDHIKKPQLLSDSHKPVTATDFAADHGFG